MPDIQPTGMGKLGYQIHTNRELGMMLRGEKPLAVFNHEETTFPPVLLRYLRMFERHVKTGKLVMQEHREPIEISGMPRVSLTVLYALPTDAWRIGEMISLRRNMSSWTEEFERREGTLLGYTDEQNDEWIATRFRKR